jgi:hypothetical protein
MMRQQTPLGFLLYFVDVPKMTMKIEEGAVSVWVAVHLLLLLPLVEMIPFTVR